MHAVYCKFTLYFDHKSWLLSQNSAATPRSTPNAMLHRLYISLVFVFWYTMHNKINNIVTTSTYTLILLPKSRNIKLWWYFGFRSDDGTSITKGHENMEACGPAAADDHPCQTAVAVSDVGGHPGGRHREFQRTLWRRPDDCCDTDLKLVLLACGGRHGGTL